MSQPKRNPEKNLRPLDRFGYHIATGLGAGHMPIAPGTFGAAEGVVLFFIFNGLFNQRLHLPLLWRLAIFIVINVIIYALGVWASNQAIKATGLKDPRVAVIDEVSGQLIAMTPLVVQPSLVGVAIAFLLFRAFDIFKPYPIHKLERLPAGFGVMSDDVLAGIFAALLTWLLQCLTWI